MTAGLVFSLLIAAATITFVLAPLFRDDAAHSAYRTAAISELQELRSEHEMVLSALKDLEDDYATGKIGDADHADLEARLTAQAVHVLKKMDAMGKRKPGSPALVSPSED